MFFSEGACWLFSSFVVADRATGTGTGTGTAYWNPQLPDRTACPWNVVLRSLHFLLPAPCSLLPAAERQENTFHVKPIKCKYSTGRKQDNSGPPPQDLPKGLSLSPLPKKGGAPRWAWCCDSAGMTKSTGDRGDLAPESGPRTCFA